MAEVERRTIEAELPSVIERLRRGASRAGVVSQRAFTAEADRLGLRTDEQRRRLRTGLAALGIQVKPSRRAAAPSVKASPARPSASTAVPATTPAVPSEAAGRLAQARRMLARYADAGGTVSKLAHDGVVRLHGLSAAQARELAADFPITRPRPPRTPVRAVTGGQAEPAAPSKMPIAKKPARSAVSATTPRLADAVLAARAVMEADRWRRGTAKVLLKAEEEVGLAVLLRGGEDRLGRTDHLGRDVPAEEIAALPRDSERWRAYECLVLHNQRLVWKIALGYQGRGLDVDDLVQHGTIGLMRAVRKFDATMGYKLSTYATQWIRQVITRAVADEGTMIRVPVHMHEKVNKVANVERRLLGEGRARTLDNVAYASGLTFAEVEEVRRISRTTDSLDRIIGDDTAFGDLIIGPSRLPGPAVVLIRKEFLARLRHVLEHLTERERHVVIRRNGLDGDEPDTLEDIGVVFGVTRERIRQIESKVKWKFRGQLDRHGLMPPPP
ncbi:sigma-70 family RNA polymerase sigma factor [Streptomyces sp. NBC_01373]|uniref:sigma-70 family RNA polymerase sigma factor n=1 Tax=Streptomyces sp. NBC_01373 TaxID=2903843 RepID=UPI0022583E26|nr:sigma-70 family RNA polymerase sigma factor [Streptomyces sp. NBC_01373]MCX4701221.1 sigma-70 family RNA polymerase sigma factor [Streptomyces sp. NBC_01373]